jgi:hypothetical protein
MSPRNCDRPCLAREETLEKIQYIFPGSTLSGVERTWCKQIMYEVLTEKVIKEAVIELTGHAASSRERMKRLHADPEYAARLAVAARERITRLHADPEFEVKRMLEYGMRKRNGSIRPNQPALLILTTEGSGQCGPSAGRSPRCPGEQARPSLLTRCEN